MQPSGMSILCPSFATTESSNQNPEASWTCRIFTDDSSTKRYVSAKVDVARDSQMVQLNNVRDLLESLLELADLQEY